jgi:hypothetical protein
VSPVFVRVSKIPIISSGSISLAKEVSRIVGASFCCVRRQTQMARDRRATKRLSSVESYDSTKIPKKRMESCTNQTTSSITLCITFEGTL